MSLQLALQNVDRRFCELLRVDPDLVSTPGVHLVANEIEKHIKHGYCVELFAYMPARSPETLVVSSTPELIEQMRNENLSPTSHEALLTFANSLNCGGTYLCDYLVADPADLKLDLEGEVVKFETGDRSAIDWNGDAPTDDVRGEVYATFDDIGMSSWAGVKHVSEAARDIQVATRPDVRRQGLARKTASHAVKQILDDGITPYYAHLIENKTSASLAHALGFQFAGHAIFAETKV